MRGTKRCKPCEKRGGCERAWHYNAATRRKRFTVHHRVLVRPRRARHKVAGEKRKADLVVYEGWCRCCGEKLGRVARHRILPADQKRLIEALDSFDPVQSAFADDNLTLFGPGDLA